MDIKLKDFKNISLSEILNQEYKNTYDKKKYLQNQKKKYLKNSMHKLIYQKKYLLIILIF